MGKRITQEIYTCNICNEIPEDGEYLWHMGRETWCQSCCDKIDSGEMESPE